MDGIVIGIDESAGSAASLRWALQEATVRGWPLTAVLGWGTLDRHLVVLGERFHRSYDLQDADDALLAVIESAVGVEPARRIGRKVACEGGAHALIAAAASADLLAVGARGAGGFHDLLLGSVAEHCLHHAPCPIAVVRTPAGSEPDAEAPSPARVVVGVDGSEHAQLALRWAVGEAGAHHAQLVVWHAWRPAVGIGEFLDPCDVEAGDKLAHHLVDAALDREDLSGLPEPPVATVALGAPAAAVLQVVGPRDLVVVGSRGGGGFAGLRLGSVGHQVARHSPCPVVVVPTEVPD